MILVSCAGAAVLAAVAVPIAAVFNPGHPGQQEVLSRAVLAFAPGLLGYGLVAHLQRVLFACHRGKMGAAAIVAGWVVVMGADVALVLSVDRQWVVAALGIGNATGMTVAGVLLLGTLVRARGAAAARGSRARSRPGCWAARRRRRRVRGRRAARPRRHRPGRGAAQRRDRALAALARRRCS